MILKAIIENKESQYRYKVRIPQINKTINDPTGTLYENLYIAQVCSLPNCIPDYVKGDIVYVAFEKDSKELPVIIGQLFREQKVNSSTEIITQEELFQYYTQTSQNNLDNIFRLDDNISKINNQLSLSNLTTPTISSTVKSGSIQYIKYGKVVLVMINAMLMKAAGNSQTIATQLPINKSGAYCGISCLRDSNAGVYTGFLYIGDNSTELKFHAHQNSVTETTYASFVYFTE